jgi:inner membrane protein
MTWRTHTFFGVTSLWLLAPVPHLLTAATLGPLALFAAFGALLPDLDASASKIRSIGIGGVQPFVPFSLLIHRTWGHRGLLHSPLGLLLAACAAGILALLGYGLPALALLLGYASHLVADACTRSGIPGWPNRADRRIYLLPYPLRFVTGSAAEETLIPLLALSVLLLFLTYAPL